MLLEPGWLQSLWLRLAGRAAHQAAQGQVPDDGSPFARPESKPVAIFYRRDTTLAAHKPRYFMLSARLSGIGNYNAPIGRATREAHRIAAALKPMPKRRPPVLKKRGRRYVWLATKDNALQASSHDQLPSLVATRHAA